MRGFLAIEPELCWRITLTLLHVGWIGLGIAVMAVIGGRALGRSAPERRYWLNFAALGLLGLSLPVTFAIVGHAAMVPDVAPPRALVEPRERPGLAVAPIRIESMPEARLLREPERNVAAAKQPKAAPAWSWPEARAFAPYVAWLYAAGVSAMLARLGLAVGGGMRLRSLAGVIVEGPLAELVPSQARRLGLRTVPTVGACARVATPVVLGLFRPMILLPAVMATGLSTEELALILAHELSHLRRFDHIFILVQRGLEAVLFFHPATWWLSRRVDREREHCCDDLVVGMGQDRLLYSTALLRVAELCLADRSLPIVAPAIDGHRRSALRRRIERLLNVADEPAVKLNRPGFLALILLVACAGGAAAFFPKREEPRQLAAKVDQVPAKAPDAPAAPPERPSVVGRLVDVQGKPVPFVTVGICRHNAHLMRPFWGTLQKWTRTDAEGRFALPAIKPGKYQILPVSGIEIIGGSTPPDQLPAEFRKYADQPGKHRFSKPLPGAFPATIVSVAADGKPAKIEIKAMPHVTFTARFIDSAGKPAEARPDAYPIYGTLNGEVFDWHGWFDLEPGKTDTMTATVPARLKDSLIQDNADNVWWTWAPGTPRVSHAGIRLKKLDGDRLEIVAQRFRSNSLEIRLRSTTGKLPEAPDVSVHYPTPFSGEGGLIPQRVAEGVYHLGEMIAPGRLCKVTVSADGFKDASTKPFQFLEEGQAGVVEVTLTPGVRTNSWNVADAQSVELKTPEGRLVPQPVEVRGPERSITCRAVDRSTGKPVADAIVKVDVERRVKEDEAESYGIVDWSDKSETKTDADGRFTVSIPEKALADRTPLATTEARITIKHPNYVSYWNSTNGSELARKPVSDSFPEFRAVKLIPGRRITGRVVGPTGHPMKDVQLYQGFRYQITIPAASTPEEVFISDLPKTDETGRFAFNAPIGAALKLEFRALKSARKYHEVPADKTDLGDIRIAPGIRVSGQVLDAQGVPAHLIAVNTPAVPSPENQPNFTQTTDKDGRFRTDELPPGTYQAVVGDFFHDEDGKPTGYNSRLAPGLYVPFPFEIRDDQPALELTLRPVPHATFVAKLTTTRPEPKPRDADGKQATNEDVKISMNKFGLRVASLGVKGTYEGAPWVGGNSHLHFSDGMKTYTVRVPKGLVDARLDFGNVVQRFRLGPDAPELFGTSYRLAKVDADLPAITLRRYRETTLKVTLVTPDGKPAAASKFESHYVREPAMLAAGVVFDTPLLQAAFEGGTARLSVLPDEEIALTVPGSSAVIVKLSEGETGTVTLTVPGAK